MMEDPIAIESPDAGDWEVFALFTDLQGAVLTTLVGEAALAGTIELNDSLILAANDVRYEGAQP